jgi:hypothetical protein
MNNHLKVRLTREEEENANYASQGMPASFATFAFSLDAQHHSSKVVEPMGAFTPGSERLVVQHGAIEACMAIGPDLRGRGYITS